MSHDVPIHVRILGPMTRTRGLVVPCHFCGKPVDTGHPGAFLFVEGWAPIREGGGANAIALRRDLGQAAHGVCVDIARNGGVIQGSML